MDTGNIMEDQLQQMYDYYELSEKPKIMEPKEKALEILKSMTYKANSLEDAKYFSIQAVNQVLQSNPTIKGTSSDFITQIVQTKAYYYRVIDEIELIKEL